MGKKHDELKKDYIQIITWLEDALVDILLGFDNEEYAEGAEKLSNIRERISRLKHMLNEKVRFLLPDDIPF